MITVKHISEFNVPWCELYNIEDKFVGYINQELVLLDVLVQISETRAKGYYLKWRRDEGDLIIPISNTGNIKRPPGGFFDQQDKLLKKLLGF